MTELDTIPAKLGIAESFVQKAGVNWLAPDPLNIRDLAKAMNDLGARFITITAYQLPASEGFRLEYHWDLNGQVLGFTYRISGDSIESIYDLCEAVDWIEREVHEGFGIEFLGRDYEPLLLRPGDKLGVNLREEAVR